MEERGEELYERCIINKKSHVRFALLIVYSQYVFLLLLLFEGALKYRNDLQAWRYGKGLRGRAAAWAQSSGTTEEKAGRRSPR